MEFVINPAPAPASASAFAPAPAPDPAPAPTFAPVPQGMTILGSRRRIQGGGSANPQIVCAHQEPFEVCLFWEPF